MKNFHALAFVCAIGSISSAVLKSQTGALILLIVAVILVAIEAINSYKN
jgi:diacylglycerol kinase